MLVNLHKSASNKHRYYGKLHRYECRGETYRKEKSHDQNNYSKEDNSLVSQFQDPLVRIGLISSCWSCSCSLQDTHLPFASRDLKIIVILSEGEDTDEFFCQDRVKSPNWELKEIDSRLSWTGLKKNEGHFPRTARPHDWYQSDESGQTDISLAIGSIWVWRSSDTRKCP